MTDEEGPTEKKGSDKKSSTGLMSKASEYGAESSLDYGIFLLGGAIGGGLDATLNIAGFAEPFVFAGSCSVGALGAKKTIEGLFY